MSNSSNQTDSTASETAAKILEDKSACLPFKDLKALVRKLKGELEFGVARKLIDRVKPPGLKPDEEVWLTQQLALCTYKDEEMLPAKRFVDALTLLKTIGLHAPDKVDRAVIPPHTLPETLALGGAVYKRMFEHSGQLENLHNALGLYRAAWNQDSKVDMGYGGVNAAYVLDLLASRLEAVARQTGTMSVEAQRLRREAETLRREMAEKLPQFAAEKDAEEERKAVAEGNEFVPLEKQ